MSFAKTVWVPGITVDDLLRCANCACPWDMHQAGVVQHCPKVYEQQRAAPETEAK